MVIIKEISLDEDEVVCPSKSASCLYILMFSEEEVEEAKEKGIIHFLHQHRLFEFRKDDEQILESKDFLCKVCYLEMGGHGFSCEGCKFYLHQICAFFTEHMTYHPYHLQHSLTLLRLKHTIDNLVCNMCETNIIRGFRRYYCGMCNFHLCLSCVALSFTVHGRHHKHALTPKLFSSLRPCSLCGEIHKELSPSFECKFCSFMIHQQCYFLPHTYQHDCHVHQLRIARSLEHSICGICERIIRQSFFTYQCGKCKYHIHLKCVYKKWDKPIIEIPGDIDELIQFPLPCDKSLQGMFAHFIKQMCGWKEMEESIDYLIHHPFHDHPLILLEKQANNGSCPEYDVSKFNHLNISDVFVYPSCNACTLLVLDSSFYKCTQSCDFVLHKWCAKLPHQMHHPLHYDSRHTLLLHERIPKSFGFFKCWICKNIGNGFAYKCNKCENCILHIRCAFLPNIVKHEAHEHPLYLKDSVLSCNSCGCNGFYDESISFDCDACLFSLDINCLLLPKEVIHRYDNHGFKLTYYVCDESIDEQVEYYCEFCEEKLNSDRWIYHCFECDKSADTTCVRRRVFNMFQSSIKLHRSYEYYFHPHPLIGIPIFWKDISFCDECSDDVYMKDGVCLFCRDCMVIYCLDCIRDYYSDPTGDPPSDSSSVYSM